MTQEEKELLIKDLCARLPYGVKVSIERDFPNNPQIVEKIAKDGEIIVNDILAYDIYYYKPYLRSLSSITEEESEEFSNMEIVGYSNYDWLNAHHFDYRGLIEKGLVLEAPEDMYSNN